MEAERNLYTIVNSIALEGNPTEWLQAVCATVMAKSNASAVGDSSVTTRHEDGSVLTDMQQQYQHCDCRDGISTPLDISLSLRSSNRNSTFITSKHTPL